MSAASSWGTTERECPSCRATISWKSSEYWHGSETVREGDLVSCPECGARFEVWTDGEYDLNTWKDLTYLLPAEEAR